MQQLTVGPMMLMFPVNYTLKQPTSTVRWAMMARWWPSRVSKAIWAISPSDFPINIWQAAASICLFWPWIFIWWKQQVCFLKKPDNNWHTVITKVLSLMHNYSSVLEILKHQWGPHWPGQFRLRRWGRRGGCRLYRSSRSESECSERSCRNTAMSSITKTTGETFQMLKCKVTIDNLMVNCQLTKHRSFKNKTMALFWTP